MATTSLAATISSVPVSGGSVTKLANVPDGASTLAVSVTGGTPTVIASSQWLPFGLAADDKCVYWADGNDANGGGAIVVAPK